MHGHNDMCDYCPIEKDAGGACFDLNGTWQQDENGEWTFSWLWKCIHYHYEMDACHCPDMLME